MHTAIVRPRHVAMTLAFAAALVVWALGLPAAAQSSGNLVLSVGGSCDDPTTEATRPISEDADLVACLRGFVGTPLEGTITLTSEGVGQLEGCGDPCTVEGPEGRATATSSETGTQRVTAQADGAEDATVTITWAPAGAAGTGGVSAGIAPGGAPDETPPALPLLAALLVLASAATWRTVARAVPA